MEFLIVVGIAVAWLCLGPFTRESERALGVMKDMARRDAGQDGDGETAPSGR